MSNVSTYLAALVVSVWSKQYLNYALLLRLGLMVTLCLTALIGVHTIGFVPGPDPWP